MSRCVCLCGMCGPVPVSTCVCQPRGPEDGAVSLCSLLRQGMVSTSFGRIWRQFRYRSSNPILSMCPNPPLSTCFQPASCNLIDIIVIFGVTPSSIQTLAFQHLFHLVGGPPTKNREKTNIITNPDEQRSAASDVVGKSLSAPADA